MKPIEVNIVIINVLLHVFNLITVRTSLPINV